MGIRKEFRKVCIDKNIVTITSTKVDAVILIIVL
jgi:hypothetical protein